MSLTGIPNISALNLASCVPVDATKCVGSMTSFMASMPKVGSGLPGVGGLPSLGGVPSLGSVPGCAPMDVTRCITSITSGVGAGTVPKLDLSACMPTTVPSLDIPGTGSLPGLSNTLPFFGLGR